MRRCTSRWRAGTCTTPATLSTPPACLAASSMTGGSATRYEVDTQDVEYQPGFLARVYQPRGRGPFPTMLDVHGGAWHIGDRLNNAAIDRGLALRGVLVVAIDFRQSQDAQYPASLIDVNLGARWLKHHAAQFNGVSRIGGLGSSSGGHQVLLTALRPTDPVFSEL